MDYDMMYYKEAISRMRDNSSKTAEIIKDGEVLKAHVETSPNIILNLGIDWSVVKGKIAEMKSKRNLDKMRTDFYNRSSIIYMSGSVDDYIDLCESYGLITGNVVDTMRKSVDDMKNNFSAFLADNRVSDEDVYVFSSKARYRGMMQLHNQLLANYDLYKTMCDSACRCLQKMTGIMTEDSEDDREKE